MERKNTSLSLMKIEKIGHYRENSLPVVEYREDIDGLRGIAILSIFLYHLFPQFIPGGFLGVDIFFVISGFLISQIIFSKLDSNTFSFFDFYRRRINRIFPALLIVIFLCFAYGFLILFPDEFVSLGKQIASASLFLSNLVLYREVSYFDLSAYYKPLLHLWSLAVEEQFYLGWPVFLYLSYKITTGNKFRPYRSHLIIGVILFITLVSFLLNVYLYLILNKQHLAFYFTGTRVWELSIGSLGAYYSLHKQKKNIPQLLNKILNFVCPFIIIFSLFYLSHDHKYLSLLMIFSLLSVLFLLAFPENLFLIFRRQKILSNDLLVFIGLISYPMYLLHWPLISFFKIISGKNIELGSASLIFFSVVLMSYGIYRYIERPIRQENSSKTAIFLWSILLTFGILGYFSSISFLKPSINHLFPQTIKVAYAFEDWNFPTPQMQKIVYQGQDFYKIGNSKEIVLFMGDSNVQQYAPRIEKIITEMKSFKSAVFAAQGGGMSFTQCRT